MYLYCPRWYSARKAPTRCMQLAKQSTELLINQLLFTQCFFECPQNVDIDQSSYFGKPTALRSKVGCLYHSTSIVVSSYLHVDAERELTHATFLGFSPLPSPCILGALTFPRRSNDDRTCACHFYFLTQFSSLGVFPPRSSPKKTLSTTWAKIIRPSF